MPLFQFSRQCQWGSILKDQLTKREIAEKKHILKEGRDAEQEFIRKH